jgi:hypothetical protein
LVRAKETLTSWQAAVASCVLCVFITSNASADIGPLAVFPVAAAACIQLLLALVLIAPSRMTGARKQAFLIFFGILAIPWIATLTTTADSLYHFVPLSIAILAAFAAMYWRVARQK